MSPKLVVMVAAIGSPEGASVSGASTSRAGSWPAEGYSHVVVSPPAAGSEDSVGSEDSEGDALEVSFAVSASRSLPHPARRSTDRQARTAAGRFSMAPIVASVPVRADPGPRTGLHLLVRVGVPSEEPAVVLAQGGDRVHLALGELEAEDVEVLRLPVRVGGLGDGQ